MTWTGEGLHQGALSAVSLFGLSGGTAAYESGYGRDMLLTGGRKAVRIYDARILAEGLKARVRRLKTRSIVRHVQVSPVRPARGGHIRRLERALMPWLVV